MNIKIPSLAVALFAIGAVISPARADESGTLLLNDDLDLNNGGPFTAVVLPGSSVTEAAINSLYSSLALASTSSVGINGIPNPVTGFETFCVETDVEFNPTNWSGSSYTYNFSTGYAIQQTDSSLTLGAAYLYAQFATGNLSNILSDFSYSSGTALESLQYEIWALQGEYDYGNPDAGLVTELASLAAANGGSGLASAGNDFGVQVLELTYPGGQLAQDQLIYTGTAVPDSGATLGLLGASLLALALWSRRKPAAV